MPHNNHQFVRQTALPNQTSSWAQNGSTERRPSLAGGSSVLHFIQRRDDGSDLLLYGLAIPLNLLCRISEIGN